MIPSWSHRKISLPDHDLFRKRSLTTSCKLLIVCRQGIMKFSQLKVASASGQCKWLSSAEWPHLSQYRRLNNETADDWCRRSVTGASGERTASCGRQASRYGIQRRVLAERLKHRQCRFKRTVNSTVATEMPRRALRRTFRGSKFQSKF